MSHGSIFLLAGERVLELGPRITSLPLSTSLHAAAAYEEEREEGGGG